MHKFLKTALACAPILLVAACGGSDDVADRLDLADPAVRFVNASPASANLDLYSGTTLQPSATNTGYPFASNYFNVSLSAADWSTVTHTGNVPIGTKVNIDPKRGNKYTIVALPSGTSSSLYVINDPYNKSLNSSSSHLRVINGAASAGTVDVYMTAGTNADISTSAPKIAAIKANEAGPASGSDAVDIPGATYQVRIFATGQRTNPLFSGQVIFDNNADVLIVTVPDAAAPRGINAFVKIEGKGAAALIPAL